MRQGSRLIPISTSPAARNWHRSFGVCGRQRLRVGEPRARRLRLHSAQRAHVDAGAKGRGRSPGQGDARGTPHDG